MIGAIRGREGDRRANRLGGEYHVGIGEEYPFAARGE